MLEDGAFMTQILIHGRLYCHKTGSFSPGEMLIRDGHIVAIGEPGAWSSSPATGRDEAWEILDARDAAVAPGLVDIHTHGRAGGDFVNAPLPLLKQMAASYLTTGVTTVIPTLASAPLPEYARASARLAEVAASVPLTADSTDGSVTPPPMARLLGFHLEGRYLHPEKRGAHALSLLAPPDAAELAGLLQEMQSPYRERQLSCPVRVSAALELDPDGTFANTAREAGAQLSLAHTTADYGTARRLIRRGITSLTHTYNAMPPLHHRAGGPVVAFFEEPDTFLELICDGFHVAPEMVRLACTMVGTERLVLISDSMEGTGCPDGDYHIAGMHVTLRNGQALTDDGHIAGSTLDLWQAVRNLMHFCRIPLADALRCATYNPAHLCGIEDTVGTLTPGCCADFLLIDDRTPADPVLRGIYLGGKPVREDPAP